MCDCMLLHDVCVMLLSERLLNVIPDDVCLILMNDVCVMLLCEWLCDPCVMLLRDVCVMFA